MPRCSSCTACWPRCSAGARLSREIIGSFYVGFGPTVGGALIGAVWGFVVGFVFLALGASLYNMLGGE